MAGELRILNEALDELNEAPDMNLKTLSVLKQQKLQLMQSRANPKFVQQKIDEIDRKIAAIQKNIDARKRVEVKPKTRGKFNVLEQEILRMISDGIDPLDIVRKFEGTVKSSVIYKLLNKNNIDYSTPKSNKETAHRMGFRGWQKKRQSPEVKPSIFPDSFK